MKSIIEKGKEVIRIEAQAVAGLEKGIDERFSRAVELIYESTGGVVLTGMGKSGIIARKIVATLNSTGTDAQFLHPSEAAHGDLGMVKPGGVLICISKSGDTEEIRELIPLVRRIGVKIIAMVGNLQSHLALQADIVLDISVEEEACPHDLAPTASTTAALAMGDALAVALLDKREFTREDFARFHPGGTLGRKLLLTVREMMVQGNDIPIVRDDVSLSEAIYVITSKRLGATCVVNGGGTLEGIITDGDLRRLLQRTQNISNLRASEAMTKHPKTISGSMLAADALREMETYNITQLIVLDESRKPVGIVHLHDLVKAGLNE
ncbi:MAG: KpsF/GutQ family sugar-phosphate isomerase [Ignavibacteria bacterium]|nr:KpsF/GutQ family sugar-phosphate isomerase [Ignavibacteria bacterium]